MAVQKREWPPRREGRGGPVDLALNDSPAISARLWARWCRCRLRAGTLSARDVAGLAAALRREGVGR